MREFHSPFQIATKNNRFALETVIVDISQACVATKNNRFLSGLMKEQYDSNGPLARTHAREGGAGEGAREGEVDALIAFSFTHSKGAGWGEGLDNGRYL